MSKFWVSSFNQFSSKTGYPKVTFLPLFILNFTSLMRYKGFKYWAHSCFQSTNSTESIKLENEKANVRGGTVNRMSDYTEAAVQSGSREKLFWEILQNLQENPCTGVCFFNKARRCRSATLLERRLQHSCFLANIVEFVRTPFLQNTTGRFLLIIAVSI